MALLNSLKTIGRTGLFTTAGFQKMLRPSSTRSFHVIAVPTEVSALADYKYETLHVSQVQPYVYHVQLNRPEKVNTMNKTMWTEVGKCFAQLGDDADCRSVILSGAGKLFCAGIDLMAFVDMGAALAEEEDIARKAKQLYKFIKEFQDSVTAVEKCLKPVIVAVHGACIGGAVDLASVADIRYCTGDAWFQIKEVDVGLAADVGTLQRFPKIVGSESLARELSFTARKMYSAEANQCGFVSRIFPDKDSMLQAAGDVAVEIARKSPVAVQGTKLHLNYSRDHTVDEALEYEARWNSAMLQSEDLMKAAMTVADKEAPPPQFSKL